MEVYCLGLNYMAIALDTTSTGSGTGTSLTVSHTVSGNNRLLVVGIGAGAADIVTGVTYNGVAMTRANERNNGNSTAYMYYLIAPALGVHNIVVSTSLSVNIQADGASFTGVHQSAGAQPDATVTNTANLTTSVATTLVTVADKSIMLATYATDATGITSITNATLIAIMGYSAIKTPAGSLTLTGNSGGVNNWATVGASFAPAPLSGFSAFM